MNSAEEAADPLMTTGEVAKVFRVRPKTIACWIASGAMAAIKTPGGHARIRESEVRRLLNADSAS